MNHLRRTEWIFVLIGAVLVSGSAALLITGISFVQIRSAFFTPGDPFIGNYAMAPALSPTPPPSSSLPLSSPAQNSATSAEIGPQEKIYLLFPANQVLLTKTGSSKKGYPLKFRFEVDPKNTSCTFELRYQDKTIISKPLNPSPSGAYEVSILIRKPGVYTWQILTPHATSESREVIVKN